MIFGLNKKKCGAIPVRYLFVLECESTWYLFKFSKYFCHINTYLSLHLWIYFLREFITKLHSQNLQNVSHCVWWQHGFFGHQDWMVSFDLQAQKYLNSLGYGEAINFWSPSVLVMAYHEIGTKSMHIHIYVANRTPEHTSVKLKWK